MQTIDTPIHTPHSTRDPDNVATEGDQSLFKDKTPDSDNLAFQLGLWFSGLESFLNLYSSDLVKDNYRRHDWSKEVHLTRSVLLRCSKITIDLSQQISSKSSPVFKGKKFELLDESDLDFGRDAFSDNEITRLSLAVRESVLFSDALLRSDSIGFRDWTVWSRSLIGKLKGIDAVQKLVRVSEREGGDFLPKAIKDLLNRNDIKPQLLSDLKVVLPLFAKILRWLNVIEQMLKNDKPLTASLLLFAKINEQMNDLMYYINNRLLRYPDEQDALFGSLDRAAYTASIELRKVYNQELKELIEIRSTPIIFAKIENSYALLNDSLQLTMLNFGQLIDPDLKSFDVFPNIKEKEEQSIILRLEMWNVLQSIKEAEQNPEKYPLDSLNEQLISFGDLSARILFYKDIETVQRFIEEVLRTKEKNDLVPTLHRFGAYLATLLCQVNMRVVLADHPFAPLESNPQGMFS